MEKYIELSVYKASYDLLLEIFKEYKYKLGESLKKRDIGFDNADLLGQQQKQIYRRRCKRPEKNIEGTRLSIRHRFHPTSYPFSFFITS